MPISSACRGLDHTALRRVRCRAVTRQDGAAAGFEAREATT